MHSFCVPHYFNPLVFALNSKRNSPEACPPISGNDVLVYCTLISTLDMAMYTLRADWLYKVYTSHVNISRHLLNRAAITLKRAKTSTFFTKLVITFEVLKFELGCPD